MRTTIKEPQPQHAEYGVYTPEFFENGIRYDLYKRYEPADDFYEYHEPVMCIDHTDLSPIKLERATYDERCNCHCCFAGYAHTVNLCADRNKKQN